MKIMSESTYVATIYVAGDIATARQVCREYCMRGLCVTVTPTTFVYTGGAEEGVAVGLLNYPRFPSEPKDLYEHARALGQLLMEQLYQHSYLVVSPTRTRFYSRRKDGGDT